MDHNWINSSIKWWVFWYFPKQHKQLKIAKMIDQEWISRCISYSNMEIFLGIDRLERVFHVHCDYLKYILKFKGAALKSCWTRIKFKTENPKKWKWHRFGLLEGYFNQTNRYFPFHVLRCWHVIFLWYLDAKKNRIPVLFHSFLMVVSHTVPQLLW